MEYSCQIQFHMSFSVCGLLFSGFYGKYSPVLWELFQQDFGWFLPHRPGGGPMVHGIQHVSGLPAGYRHLLYRQLHPHYQTVSYLAVWGELRQLCAENEEAKTI